MVMVAKIKVGLEFLLFKLKSSFPVIYFPKTDCGIGVLSVTHTPSRPVIKPKQVKFSRTEGCKRSASQERSCNDLSHYLSSPSDIGLKKTTFKIRIFAFELELFLTPEKASFFLLKKNPTFWIISSLSMLSHYLSPYASTSACPALLSLLRHSLSLVEALGNGAR